MFEFTELSSASSASPDVGAFVSPHGDAAPSCHSLRSLHLGDQPRRLLQAVRGLALVELPESDQCCGFGGTFALKNADVSSAMASDKVRCVLETERRGLHGGRQLVPDADRRRAQPAAAPPSAACTSPSSSPAPHRPGRRDDPRRRRRHGAWRSRPLPRTALANAQLRRNVRHATTVIRNKRASVVGEMDDWEALRDAAHAIKDHTLRYLDVYLAQFEERCTRAGGHVHWARDADEANRIVIDIIRARGGQSEIIKVKTMTSDETRLNVALAAGRHRAATRPTWPS